MWSLSILNVETKLISIQFLYFAHLQSVIYTLHQSMQQVITNFRHYSWLFYLVQAHRELQCCEAFKDYSPPVQKSLCKVGWYQR